MTPSDRSPPDHAGRVYGTGPIGAELHIRPGPAIGGSAESCGNASAFNAGEILPCADRGPLHMGEHQRKVDNSQESRNHAENPRSAREGAPLRCAIPPLSPRGARATSRAQPRPDPAVEATGSAGSALTRALPLSRGAPEPAPSIRAWAVAPPLCREVPGSAAPAPAARGGESGAPPPTGPACRRRRRGSHCAGWCAPRSR